MLPADITLILPTRDEARNVRQFLASVPAEIRLIVVDASRDETPDLIETLRPEHTLVLREPGSVTQARQRGADLATDRLAAVQRCRHPVSAGLFREARGPFRECGVLRTEALARPLSRLLQPHRTRAGTQPRLWNPGCIGLQSTDSAGCARVRGRLRSQTDLQRGFGGRLASSACGVSGVVSEGSGRSRDRSSAHPEQPIAQDAAFDHALHPALYEPDAREISHLRLGLLATSRRLTKTAPSSARFIVSSCDFNRFVKSSLYYRAKPKIRGETVQ